jgi:hypothetical protein
MHKNSHTYTHIFACTHTCTSLQYTRKHMYTYGHHTHTHTRTSTHTHTHTYVHTHNVMLYCMYVTHIYMYVHTLATYTHALEKRIVYQICNYN